MIGNIFDNTTELYMIKYTFGEIFSSGGATLYKNPSDQTVTELFERPLDRLEKIPENVDFSLWGKQCGFPKIALFFAF